MRTKQRFDADHLRVAYISKMLKDMTLDLHIPIIALAQVKRFAGGGRAKMPTLEDLKDSGAIEQDADGVIFLHRPEDTEDPYVDSRDYGVFNSLKDTSMQYMAFGIAKQRQGATGYTNAIFNPSVMRYTAIDRS
jgi:replicative DNA helicase